MNELMKKITLLLLCVPSSMMVGLLTSSLIYMYQEYAEYNESIVTMILTIPNLTIMIGLVLAPILVKKIPIKYVILTGMGLFVVTSLLPVWCESFYLLLTLRALCGVGVGLILPLQMTFIASYPEQERAALMGLSTTVGCIIAAMVVAISGVIAAINWRYVFYLYLFNLIGLILAFLFIPRIVEETDNTNSETAAQNTGHAPKLSSYGNVLFLYYFLLIGSYLFISVLTAEMAPYLENVGMGGSAESGVLMSIYMIGTAVAGLILGKYLEVTKGFAMSGVFMLSAIGLALLWVAPSIIVAGIAVLLIGICAALVVCVVNYELSCVLPLSLFTTASAGTNFFVFVMQFIAPMIFIVLLDEVGGSFQSVFMIYAVIQVVFMTLAMFLPKILFRKA